MKKFAIAFISFYDNDNTIEVVEAYDIMDALRIFTKQKFSDDFIFDSIEEYKELFFNADSSISTPLEIK